MMDVWNTLESAFDVIIGNLRTAEKDLPEHEIQAIDGWHSLMDFLLFENQAINGEIVSVNHESKRVLTKGLNQTKVKVTKQ